MWTRDSIIWWLGIAGALLAYLSQAPTPTTWDYAEYVKAASLLVATISAKLATSPLAGKPKQEV